MGGAQNSLPAQPVRQAPAKGEKTIKAVTRRVKAVARIIADLSFPNWCESNASPTQVKAFPNKLIDSAK